MHSVHGDIHEIGLQDGCPACREHAEAPWGSLDRDMLDKLIARNHFYRFNNNPDLDSHNYAPRSYNEGLAMVEITNVMERIGKLMESFDGTRFIKNYLERNWDIDFGDGC